MYEESLELIRILSEAPGVSGFEKPIRDKLIDYLKPLSSEIRTDHLGSLVATKKGKRKNPQIMLAAHMDEVGFMVSQLTEEGFIKIQPLGGWWSQVMLDQRVVILTDKGMVPGIIGSKSPHILTDEDLKHPVQIKHMFIDVGAICKEETEDMGIKQGDPVVPHSTFTMCKNNKSFMAKALDNRLGCAMVVELFRRLNQSDHPNTFYGVMTVQEEVGLRGAATSVDVVKPDLAVVIDVTISTDTPGIRDSDVATKVYLGKGPVIGFYDATMIPHIPLRDLVVKTAKENNIPYQIEFMSRGGTDAGKIHIYRQGVPTIVIGVAVRYIHDHVGIAHIEDYCHGVDLIYHTLKELDGHAYAMLLDKMTDEKKEDF